MKLSTFIKKVEAFKPRTSINRGKKAANLLIDKFNLSQERYRCEYVTGFGVWEEIRVWDIEAQSSRNEVAATLKIYYA